VKRMEPVDARALSRAIHTPLPKASSLGTREILLQSSFIATKIYLNQAPHLHSHPYPQPPPSPPRTTTKILNSRNPQSIHQQNETTALWSSGMIRASGDLFLNSVLYKRVHVRGLGFESRQSPTRKGLGVCCVCVFFSSFFFFPLGEKGMMFNKREKARGRFLGFVCRFWNVCDASGIGGGYYTCSLQCKRP